MSAIGPGHSLTPPDAASALTDRVERVLDLDPGDPTSGLEVLADEGDCPGTSRGLDDEGVPERQLGPLLESCCVQDQPDVDLDNRPRRVQRDDLASLRPAHRWLELAGRD